MRYKTIDPDMEYW